MSKNKVTPITLEWGSQNKRDTGTCESVTGFVKDVISLTDLGAVAFSLEGIGEKAGEEKLFWISVEESNADHRTPLQGQRIQVQFDEKSLQNLDVFGEKAQGVAEIKNLTNASEESAFAWFHSLPDGKVPWL